MELSRTYVRYGNVQQATATYLLPPVCRYTDVTRCRSISVSNDTIARSSSNVGDKERLTGFSGVRSCIRDDDGGVHAAVECLHRTSSVRAAPPGPAHAAHPQRPPPPAGSLPPSARSLLVTGRPPRDALAHLLRSVLWSNDAGVIWDFVRRGEASTRGLKYSVYHRLTGTLPAYYAPVPRV